MKFLDFLSLFDTEPAYLAVLSTYQLDPDFFERRLLRCPALARARRILVFMDASQWCALLGQEAAARLLNKRYLVVPVRPGQGVFHPKLNLLASETGGQLQCGSNNLTRSGCSSNLEILNAFSIRLEGENDEAIRLAQGAYAFYMRACDDAEEESARIARDWLRELPKYAPWVSAPLPQNGTGRIELVHTYQGKLWDRLATLFDESPPKKVMVISPYYDANGEMAKRIHRRWPRCRLELVVQQRTTTLDTSALRRHRRLISLFEIRNSARRLHAKVLAWESAQGTRCLVGSANFTAAAYDARNIEACLLITDAEPLVAGLFDKQLEKRKINFEDFESGSEQEPRPRDIDAASLRLVSALLTTGGRLRVSYTHRLAAKSLSLRVALRVPGESRPRALLSLPPRISGTAVVNPPESALQDAHGSLLASLVVDVETQREESPPVWVILEGRLTYESADGGASSPKAKVEETGEGLTELLEELGKNGGVAAIIEYLRHLSIRFHDGGGRSAGQRRFRLRVRDPFHPDVTPDWLLHSAQAPSLAEAIYDFVDRHKIQRLRKHARRGNINGMENFLDIFTTMVRLLYLYYGRGVVDRNQIVPRIRQYLELATSGCDTGDEIEDGYLCSVYENLEEDSEYLQEVCDELNFLGHLRAALLIVQRVRFVPGEKSQFYGAVLRPGDCLPSLAEKLRGTIKEVNLREPTEQEIFQALDEYKMFSAEELIELK